MDRFVAPVLCFFAVAALIVLVVEDRELLLRAFAAQSAIDWPDLAATFEDS